MQNSKRAKRSDAEKRTSQQDQEGEHYERARMKERKRERERAIELHYLPPKAEVQKGSRAFMSLSILSLCSSSLSPLFPLSCISLFFSFSHSRRSFSPLVSSLHIRTLHSIPKVNKQHSPTLPCFLIAILFFGHCSFRSHVFSLSLLLSTLSKPNQSSCPDTQHQCSSPPGATALAAKAVAVARTAPHRLRPPPPRPWARTRPRPTSSPTVKATPAPMATMVATTAPQPPPRPTTQRSPFATSPGVSILSKEEMSLLSSSSSPFLLSLSLFPFPSRIVR